MKILCLILAAVVCFSVGTAEISAFDSSSVLHGFIKLPETAGLTKDNITIYVVGREQKTAKPDSVFWEPAKASWGFTADTDNMKKFEIVINKGENVAAVVNFNGSKGFGLLTYERNRNLMKFSEIVSFAPCQIYQSVQTVVCGK